MSHKAKFVMIICLQVAALFGMIALKHYPLVSGEKIMLKVMPVDPRSLMRGDYVDLRYEISRPGRKSPAVTGRNGRIYAKVKKGADGVYHPEGYYSEAPLTGPGEIVLKGRVDYRGAKYGIESYFVEEGKGIEIEKLTRSGQVYAVIAVTSSGKAALDRLVNADGAPLK